MDPLLERALHPELRVGHGILEAEVLAAGPGYLLVSQPGPMERLADAVVASAAASREAGSLAEPDLLALVGGLPSVDRVVGVGGGVTMDTAKFVAWRTGLPLLLAPSIVSVDASVTNTVAVRREGRVEYDGFVVADAIVADLDLIAAAPARLNRAGVGDLLSIHTGRFDWALGACAGRIDLDEAVHAEAGRVLDGLLALAPDVAAVTDRALEAILRGYVDVNRMCLTVGHSGPEEGSEHYFAYQAEALTGRSFVHGEIVGLGTVLMAGLQGNQPDKVAGFLDRCGVAWRPDSLGLGRSTLLDILVTLPAFVREAGLPWSILDEAALDERRAAALLDALPAPFGGVPADSGGSPR